MPQTSRKDAPTLGVDYGPLLDKRRRGDSTVQQGADVNGSNRDRQAAGGCHDPTQRIRKAASFHIIPSQ